ncbi:MAG: hypothetical protein WBW92_10460 [Rhodanobacteraceae bacterium]
MGKLLKLMVPGAIPEIRAASEMLRTGAARHPVRDLSPSGADADSMPEIISGKGKCDVQITKQATQYIESCRQATVFP